MTGEEIDFVYDWTPDDPMKRQQMAAALETLIATRVVEARREGAAEVEAKALALADQWYPGTPGPRRMTSWGQAAMEKCARELRATLRDDTP